MQVLFYPAPSVLYLQLCTSPSNLSKPTRSPTYHIFYIPPPSPPPHAVSPFTPYLALWPLTLHIPLSVCFDVTSERVVCNAHYAAVTLYFVRLLSGVRLARFRGRNMPNVSDAFVVDSCGYIVNVIVYIDAR